MLKIDGGNNITLTRGDTLTLTVTLKRGAAAYTPEPDDVIRLAISEGYVGETAYKLKYSATIPNNTLTVTVPASETVKLDYRRYYYDVEITHGDGCVDTVISGTLTITGEAK